VVFDQQPDHVSSARPLNADLNRSTAGAVLDRVREQIVQNPAEACLVPRPTSTGSLVRSPIDRSGDWYSAMLAPTSAMRSTSERFSYSC
jgi:hypothetical protein